MDPSIRDPNWREESAFQKKQAGVKTNWITTLTIGNPKLVNYDSSKLLRIGALWSIGCKGTVFNLQLFKSLMQYVFVFSIGFLILFVKGEGWLCARGSGDAVFQDEIISAFETIHGNLRKPTMFIFGLFTSLTIGRWWALRVSALGKVMDAIVHVTTFLSMAVEKKKDLRPEVRAEIEQDVHKVIKLGVTSLQCIAQISRGDEYMRVVTKTLVEDQLVTKSEAELLNECPDGCFLCWSWIYMIGDNVLTRLGMPPPNHNPFIASVQDSSMAITRIQAFHDSQLPFPYVHMMVLLVNVNNLLISVIDGMHFARVVTGACAIGELATGRTCMAAISTVLHLFLVPTMYQGLLHICFLLEDPMGDDITDFPIKSFQGRVYNHCTTILKASHDFWQKRQAADAARLAAAPAAPAEPASAPIAAPAPAPAHAPEVLALIASLPPEVLKSVEAEIARRFESEMAKHVEDLTASEAYLTRRTGTLQSS